MKKSFKRIPFALTLMASAVSSTVWAVDPTPVEVDQTVANTGAVTNTTPSLTGSTSLSLGTGASAAASATGAVASVSVSSIDAVLPNPAGNFSTIDQAVNNSGTVKNGDTGASAALIDLKGGDIGVAGSASSSASGAVASVSISATTTTTGGAKTIVLPSTTGAITQGTLTGSLPILNTGAVSNYATISGGDDLSTGASASIGASGAVGSVSIRVVSESTGATSSTVTGSNIGDIGQVVENQGAAITNVGYAATPAEGAKSYALTVDALGIGASASISASGSVAAVSTSMVNTDLNAMNYGDVTQNSKNSGTVSNTAQVDGISAGALSAGASVSIGATGAVASVSTAMLNGDLATLDFGVVGQTVTNSGSVTNTGDIKAGALGTAASASVSATGAVGSFSLSSVNGTVSGVTVGAITQTVSNNESATTVQNTGSTLSVGALGDGATASVSASGAVASVSVLGMTETSVATGSTFAVPTLSSVTQTATNLKGVTNTTASITIDGTMGQGASASIGSTGAVSSISVTTNNESTTKGTIGNILQTATNGESAADGAKPAIQNGGSIIVSGATAGAGSSIGVSATGAVTSVSITSLKDDTLTGTMTVGSIGQTVNNYGSVTNTGSISFTSASLGTGASASLSASGAVTSVSFKTVQ